MRSNLRSRRPNRVRPDRKCPAFAVNPIRRQKNADEVQYKQLVKANVPVAPIHSGLDGGMNRVFLAQVGGNIPPARVPPSGFDRRNWAPVSSTDNNGSLASKLFSALRLPDEARLTDASRLNRFSRDNWTERKSPRSLFSLVAKVEAELQ